MLVFLDEAACNRLTSNQLKAWAPIGQLFIDILLDKMNPYPEKNSVLAWEEGFSAMKAWIHRNRDFALGELSGDLTSDPYAMLWEGVFESMTPDKIVGWYRNCVYVI
ncbi:hypothetical protein BYT27DRAFT_7224462 [Phlegmacium glaucopus]|nr:hypothetical protein BYT27DRAFT_7224462 [Phlegmacium glaucopus]